MQLVFFVNIKTEKRLRMIVKKNRPEHGRQANEGIGTELQVLGLIAS